MMWMVTPAAVVAWATAALALLVAWIASRQERSPGSKVFSCLMLAVAQWALFSGLQAAAVPFTTRLWMSKLEYVGFTATPVLFLLFSARLSGYDRWLHGGRRIAIWIPAIATFVLALTNDWHRMLWADFVYGPAGTNELTYTHGPAYYVVAAQVYLFVLAGCALVARSAIRHSGVRRRLAITVLLASAVPLVVGVLYVVDVALVPGVDLIPVSFLVTGLVFLVGIGLFRVFDLSSAARSALVEQTADAVVVADADGRIVDANPAASQWLTDEEMLLGRSTVDVLAKWPALRAACAGKQGARMELTLREDPLLHVDAHVTPLREPHGQDAGCFVVLRDITLRYRNELEIRRVSERLAAQVREIEALHEELREQAIRDSLTSLFNRRYLDEILPRELERATHQGGVLSAVMIDIDNFKTLNDQYGHREGDRLLSLLGEVLRQGTRPTDAACRYGGEEFLLVLPGASSETAQERIESLRGTFAARLHAEGFESPPTLSGGIATFPTHARFDDALLRAADKALYQAKAAGRNRICVAGGQTE